MPDGPGSNGRSHTGRYLPILITMRRKAGTLVPLEVAILESALLLRARGQAEFHGYLIAQEIGKSSGSRNLTSHGTLYKALGRMRGRGWLEAEWEDAGEAASAERPRRRLYRITALGEDAYRGAAETVPGNVTGRERLRPS